jgi:DNA repair exonuclease SbcCD ATPase subunit
LEEKAGLEGRVCVRVNREVGEAWAALTRPEKVRLATAFKELILYYVTSRRLPIPPLQVLLQATDTIATAYTVCEQEKRKLQEQISSLEEELEELKQKLAIGETYKQQLEALNKQLEEEKARGEQLRRQAEQLKERVKHTEAYVERLQQTLCPHQDKLKTILQGDQRATVELEALCWRRKTQT